MANQWVASLSHISPGCSATSNRRMSSGSAPEAGTAIGPASKLLFFGGLLLAGCTTGASPDAESVQNSAATGTLSEVKIAEIRKFCGDCHAVPLPSTFPKANWQEEVRQGYQFYIDSKRTDLVEPVRQDAINYFRDAAPDKIIVPRADAMKAEPTEMRFELGPSISTGTASPATAHLVWDEPRKTMYFSDMRQGTLHQWKPGSVLKDSLQLDPPDLLVRGKNICRIHVCDWNSDGISDFLLGEMGSFPVGDHQNGRVTLQLGNADGSFKTVVLGEPMARVVSAVAFDYDGDGDNDVLVAEFGWRATGALKLLRNVGGTLEQPEMEVEIIDRRHGSLGVELGDIDGDGTMDFVVAFAQEFETVEAFLNRGAGNFERQVLMSLPDPSYNSSSFQLVDIDRDGKLDIIHTCGDTLDAFLAKPYHGLRWLRNLGDGKWETRELGMLVGALHAATADFDGDGDLDIVGVSLFPKAHLESPGAFDSICVWEQRENLQFVRHSIERDRCNIAACVAADVNFDGRIDLVVGEWGDDLQASLRVFWNTTPERH
jgi:hypothetical protein